MGVINAFKEVFPTASLSGCYYHFNRAIWKHAKQLRLTSTRDGVKIAKLTSNLPYIPAEQIKEAWLTVKGVALNCPVMDSFISYFERQWMRMPPSEISCAGQRHRTNNAVEAWHRRLNARMPHKPPLMRFLFKIKKDNKFQEIKINNHLFSYGYRSKSDATFDKKCRAELQKFNEREITIIEYLQKIDYLKSLRD